MGSGVGSAMVSEIDSGLTRTDSGTASDLRVQSDRGWLRRPLECQPWERFGRYKQRLRRTSQQVLGRSRKQWFE